MAPQIWTSLSSKPCKEDGDFKTNYIHNRRFEETCRGYKNTEVSSGWGPSLHKVNFFPVQWDVY